MKDKDVIEIMRVVADRADSDVLADDLHSLANSFHKYSELNVEEDESEQREVPDKHEVMEWLKDELRKQDLCSEGALSFAKFPLDYKDENPPAIRLRGSLAERWRKPEAPDGWEWKRYTNDKYANYLVKTDD